MLAGAAAAEAVLEGGAGQEAPQLDIAVLSKHL